MLLASDQCHCLHVRSSALLRGNQHWLSALALNTGRRPSSLNFLFSIACTPSFTPALAQSQLHHAYVPSPPKSLHSQARAAKMNRKTSSSSCDLGAQMTHASEFCPKWRWSRRHRAELQTCLSYGAAFAAMERMVALKEQARDRDAMAAVATVMHACPTMRALQRRLRQ
jgi:hypothetical protein